MASSDCCQSDFGWITTAGGINSPVAGVRIIANEGFFDKTGHRRSFLFMNDPGVDCCAGRLLSR